MEKIQTNTPFLMADYNTAIDCVITATNSLGVSSADSNDAIIQGYYSNNKRLTFYHWSSFNR
jgi:hypothetical protein